MTCLILILNGGKNRKSILISELWGVISTIAWYMQNGCPRSPLDERTNTFLLEQRCPTGLRGLPCAWWVLVLMFGSAMREGTYFVGVLDLCPTTHRRRDFIRNCQKLTSRLRHRWRRPQARGTKEKHSYHWVYLILKTTDSG